MSQGFGISKDNNGELFSQQVGNDDNDYVERRNIVDGTPWPSWTPALVQNHRHELHRVAIGPPKQNRKTISNSLDNVMNGMQGGIYVKIYNFNKAWKMPDNWTDPYYLRKDEQLQEELEKRLRGAESIEPVDIDSESDVESYEEDESLIDILNEKEENEGSSSVKGIAAALTDLLSFNYISVLKMANLFYGRNRNDYPFMRVPIVWKIIMNHLENVHRGGFDDLVTNNSDGTVEQFMEAVVPPEVHGGHGWRLYLLIYMVLRRFIKYKVGMVTENLKNRWNGYLANEESFAYAYGLEISVKKGNTFSKNNYDGLTKSQKNAIMERIEKECHRNFAKFGRMECKKLAYYKYVKNNTTIWPTTDAQKNKRKRGDYPTKIPQGTKIKEVTTIKEGKYNDKDLLEQSENVDLVDDKLWCGPKIMQIKHGKEYVYAENNAFLLQNLNKALVKLFNRLKSSKKKFKIQHTSGILEFKVTNHKEAEPLYDEKQYLERWAYEDQPLIWTQIKELLKGTRVERRKVNPKLKREIGKMGSRTVERKSKKGKKNPRMLKDLMADLNLKF